MLFEIFQLLKSIWKTEGIIVGGAMATAVTDRRTQNMSEGDVCVQQGTCSPFLHLRILNWNTIYVK